MGQTRNRAKFRNTVSAQRELITNSANELGIDGYWKVDCHKPIHVSDPGKVQHLLGNYAARLSRLQRGVITAKELPGAILRLHYEDQRKLREFERLLTGGGLRWQAEIHNLIVNTGLDHALDVTLSGASQISTWYVGLLAATPSPAAGWTATEIGTNDFVDYDESTLQTFTDAGVSSQSMDNSASPAAFTCDTNSSTVGGAFLISTNAKVTPSGTVFSAGAFSEGNKSLDDNDVINATSTYTSADA